MIEPNYFTQGEVNRVTVDVSDLEGSEDVVLRIDATVQCKAGSSPTGNLQANVDEATIVAGPVGNAVSIPSGAQTVPFKAVGNVIFPGTIIVDKVTDPSAAPDEFDFQVTAPGADPIGEADDYDSGEFSLADATLPWNSGPIDPSEALFIDPDDTSNNPKPTLNTLAGDYTVEELIGAANMPAGWQFDEVVYSSLETIAPSTSKLKRL